MKVSKYYNLCMAVIFCLIALMSSAQDTAIVYQRLDFSVYQDTSINVLLYKYKEYNTTREFAEGYRIQIMYTDIRDDVYKAKAAMYVEFPELNPYVEYEQPYFKLRLGDFKTRLEATYYLQKVIPIYSGAFIVHDKIRIK